MTRFRGSRPLYEGTLENRKHWKDLAEKVEMGLTWIDHDKIEIPVEEFFSESDRSYSSLVPENSICNQVVVITKLCMCF